MRFKSYQEFKKYVREDYRPIASELVKESGFAPGAHWALHSAPRFYRALQKIDQHFKPKMRLVDVGAFPGSLLRLARAAFADRVELFCCGLPVEESFQKEMADESITFLPCNLDPDIVCPLPIASKIPLDSDSVDFVTCTEVVEHLYSLRTVMTEAFRILRPGGILYVTTNNVAHREGLLRLFGQHTTNLDHDIDQTSIWSDSKSQWRGHVRFFSIPQLREVGERAGFDFAEGNYFEHHEDPDVFIWNRTGPLGAIRKLLRGDGSRPPIRIAKTIRGIYHLGPKAFSPHFRSHIELVLRKSG